MRSFKEFLSLQLEYSEKVIQQLIDRWDEDETNIRDYIQKFDRYKQSPLIVKKDLFQYKTFRDLETVVDAAETKSLRKKKQKGKIEPEVSKENLATAIVDDENVTIYLADDEHKCIQHGQGYTFCIAKQGSGNMYTSYRISKASTFYYVFFKNIPKSDDKHIMVLDVTRNGYEVTFKDNKTEPRVTWDYIVEIYKKYNIDFNQYKDVFKNNELGKNEKANLEILKSFQRASPPQKLEIWEKANEEQELLILKSGSEIPFTIWEKLSKFERNEHLGIGANLQKEIADDLTPSEGKRYQKVREISIPQLVEYRTYVPNKWDEGLEIIKSLSKKAYDSLVKEIKIRKNHENGPFTIYAPFLRELPPELKEIVTSKFSLSGNGTNLKSLDNLPKDLRSLFLNSIDVEEIKIPDNIKVLSIYENKLLDRIHISKSSNLEVLTIRNCKNLKNISDIPKTTKDLGLVDVGLLSLPIKNVEKLEYLNLDSVNGIRQLHVPYSKFVKIKLCFNLEKLTFDYINDLSIADCEGLYHLSDLDSVKQITLTNVGIESINLKETSQFKTVFLDTCRELEKVNLRNHEMVDTYTGVTITNCSRLKDLVLPPKIRTYELDDLDSLTHLVLPKEIIYGAFINGCPEIDVEGVKFITDLERPIEDYYQIYTDNKELKKKYEEYVDTVIQRKDEFWGKNKGTPLTY